MRMTNLYPRLKSVAALLLVLVYQVSVAQTCAIICPDPVTVYCNDLDAVYPPLAILDCGGTLELTNTTTADVCLAAVKEEITRTYTISGGSYTGPDCKQVIIVERIEPSDIEIPTNKTAGDALSCTTTAADTEATGLPQLCRTGQTSFVVGTEAFTNDAVVDMAALDADGDGKEDDVVIATYSPGTSPSVFNAIYTSENGVFSLYHTFPTMSGFTLAVEVLDWDNDGEANDIVFANADPTVPSEIWTNSNGNYIPRAFITSPVASTGVTVIDIDGDGQSNDLVFSNLDGGGTADNGYVINTTAQVIQMQTIPSSNADYLSVTTSDSDNDGISDRVVLAGDQQIRIYDVTGGSFTMVDNITGFDLYGRGVALDVDGDGPDDLIFGGLTGNVLLVHDNGSYTASSILSTVIALDIVLIDADLDGETDDLIVTADNEIDIYIRESGNFTQLASYPTEGITALPIDLNDDGRMDFITSGLSYTTQRYYNTSSPTNCMTLTPNTNELANCQSYLGYVDDVTTTPCAERVERVYTYTDWSCNTTVTETWTQVIDIKDKDGPVFDCPSDMVRSTMTGSCMAAVALPVPAAMDVCNPGGGRLDVGTPVGLQVDYQGQAVTLPVGDHTIYYTYYDLCGNPTFCTFQLLIEDNDDPIAICHPNLIVSLGIDGTAPLMAMTVGGSSFDECDPNPELLIARVDADGNADATGYVDMLTIDCDDLPEVMVGLQVTDSLGNVGICMTMIDVQDNYSASIQAPAAVTIDCTVPIDENNLSPTFGTPTIAANCMEVLTIHDTIVGQVSSCGGGSLERQLSLIDADGTIVSTDTQEITVAPSVTLLETDITWPPAVVEFTGVEDLGEPSVVAPDCSDILMRKEDEQFVFSANEVTAGACYKIERTWFVVDRCLPAGSEGGVLRPFEFMQIIKVINNDSPELTTLPTDSTVICTYAVDCDSLIPVNTLQAVATDVGTPTDELLGQAVVFDADGNEVVRYQSLNANGSYKIGTYEVLYTVEDGCGNFDQATISFEVQNCKLPQPVAIAKNITIGTNPFIVTPAYFDASSNHPCGYDITLSFSADPAYQELELTCDNLGMRTIEFWVTDSNGRQNSVELEILVDATEGLCPDSQTRAAVYGEISMSSGTMLDDVEVVLRGEASLTETTSGGYYDFGEMPTGGSYSVEPRLDEHHLLGVNTLDVVLIQRHILQLQEFQSAHQHIAADINGDGRVRASDLLELRKLILGSQEKFSNNTSYRFVTADYVFEDVTDPLSEAWLETYDVAALTTDMEANFNAIKVGDIDGSVANYTSEGEIETRSNKSLDLLSRVYKNYDGYNTKIEIVSNADMLLHGVQGVIDVKSSEILEVIDERLSIEDGNYLLRDGMLHFSIAEEIAVEITAGQVLFSMMIKGAFDANTITLAKEESIANEAYVGSDIQTVSLTLGEQREGGTQQLVTKASPNPWVSSTKIEVVSPQDGELQLTVYDAAGHLLMQRTQVAHEGSNTITIDDTDISNSGLIIYEVNIGSQVSRGKLLKVN